VKREGKWQLAVRKKRPGNRSNNGVICGEFDRHFLFEPRLSEMRARHLQDSSFVCLFCFGILATVLCILAMYGYPRLLRVIWRLAAIGFVTYLIMLCFYGNGGRCIIDTFWVSLSVVAGTYFVINTSWSCFFAAIAVCFFTVVIVSS
jgi:hypothetical protein